MRSPLLRLFRQSPFNTLLEHAEKLQEGGETFRKAVWCYLDGYCEEFEQLHLMVTRIESEADRIKRNIRGHLPRGIMMPVDKFLFLLYLRAQDHCMDALQDTLHWLSYRKTEVPDALVDDLLFLVDKAVEVVEQVPVMTRSFSQYLRTFSNQERDRVKEVIHTIRQKEGESDQIERKLLSDVFANPSLDPSAAFHLTRLIENIGEISNNAENAGDMMRAMIAR